MTIARFNAIVVDRFDLELSGKVISFGVERDPM